MLIKQTQNCVALDFSGIEPQRYGDKSCITKQKLQKETYKKGRNPFRIPSLNADFLSFAEIAFQQAVKSSAVAGFVFRHFMHCVMYGIKIHFLSLAG